MSEFKGAKIAVNTTQWVRALTPQAEGWVFESQPGQQGQT